MTLQLNEEHQQPRVRQGVGVQGSRGWRGSGQEAEADPGTLGQATNAMFSCEWCRIQVRTLFPEQQFQKLFSSSNFIFTKIKLDCVTF